ncbi:hypothetical protein U2446_15260, partial [Listeria monocytogenes]|uniref:hypothetical protein n=1 Tax=Listeria monocytogenes TaxID=1639 RepID=UPI002FDC03E5
EVIGKNFYDFLTPFSNFLLNKRYPQNQGIFDQFDNSNSKTLKFTIFIKDSNEFNSMTIDDSLIESINNMKTLFAKITKV